LSRLAAASCGSIVSAVTFHNRRRQVKFFSDPELRRRYGGVSAMTLWRWRQAGLLPQPTNFNGRNYTAEPDVLACDKNFLGCKGEEAA
jgi:hypothetical protein